MNQSQQQDHFKRNFIITCIIAVTLCILFYVLTQVYLFIPLKQQLQQFADDHKAEQKQVEAMTCEQLHDGMLHNTIQWSDDVQRASERYVSGCEGQK